MADATAIAAIMQQMWTQFRPQMEERAAMLATAAESLSMGRLSEEERRAAEKTAHTLAGSLGTFGLSEGTTLAREAEALLALTELGDVQAARLVEIAATIHGMIVAKA